jgi:hypothetical protein
MAPDNEDQLPKAQKSQKPPKVDEPLAELTAFEQRIQDAKDKCRQSHVVVVCGQKIQTIPKAMWQSRHKQFQNKGYELA